MPQPHRKGKMGCHSNMLFRWLLGDDSIEKSTEEWRDGGMEGVQKKIKGAETIKRVREENYENDEKLGIMTKYRENRPKREIEKEAE